MVAGSSRRRDITVLTDYDGVTCGRMIVQLAELDHECNRPPPGSEGPLQILFDLEDEREDYAKKWGLD